MLSLERMDRIRAIDERDLVAEVEAGVVPARLQEAVEERGLFYPPDPASRESCRIGGNVGEDSAGPRSCKYGSTRRWVLGLEAVLADGAAIRTGSRCRKDATGYDLTQLLVGSEGTLAVVTAATLRLIAKPRATLTALLPFPTLEAAAAAVERLFPEGIDPAACELLEEAALAAVARLEPLPAPLVGSAAMLLVELHGDDRDDAARARRPARGGGARGRRRRGDRRRRRRGSAPALAGAAEESARRSRRSRSTRKRTPWCRAPGSPTSSARRDGRRSATASPLSVYGHAGDGNLHVNLLRGALDASDWERRRDACRGRAASGRWSRWRPDLRRARHRLGRSDGTSRSPSSARPIDLHRDLKRLFDPYGILNPRKILPDPP